MSKISIITTTYKHQDFIEETIKSVLSQTYTDWELLIWDDSPDDKTWQIIQKYVKKYPDKIKAWHHSINKWIVENMNFLIEKSNKNSKYIAFLEWDDLFTSNNLEEKVIIFNKYKDVKLVYNNLDFIDWKWNIVIKNYFKNVSKIINNNTINIIDYIIWKSFYNSYSTLMLNKNILNEIKIVYLNNDKMYLTSDWDLFWKIAKKYNIFWIKKSLTLYRVHWNNNSSDKIKLISDLIVWVKSFINKYWLNKNKKVNYKLLHLNIYLSYLKKEKIKTIKYWILSFKYSLTKNFKERIWMIFFSLLPNKINNYLYKKFKK